MKIVWKGAISFGLVNIPVNLYAAIDAHPLGFTLLHATCHTPLQYHRWCPYCEKEVVWAQTVKGLKLTGDQYLIITKEALSKLHPQKTELITIVEFVDADKIAPLYYNHQYYLKPARGASNGYALFAAALRTMNTVAIGRFVMRDKEYTCMIQPYENYLILTTLHYTNEIRGIETLEFPKITVHPHELRLAEQLIRQLLVDTFDMSKFKDAFAQRIKTLIKTESQKKKSATRQKKGAVSKVKPHRKESLEETLQASLESSRKKTRATITSRVHAQARARTKGQ